jgi:hypothetical protein
MQYFTCAVQAVSPGIGGTVWRGILSGAKRAVKPFKQDKYQTSRDARFFFIRLMKFRYGRTRVLRNQRRNKEKSVSKAICVFI